MMSLSQICAAVSGRLQANGHSQDQLDSLRLQNVAINTREDCAGRLFVALKGENFDAHDFLDKARAAGAAALLVERAVESDLPVIQVQSTHQALKDVAAWWRSQFAIPVLGITGSVGKTTVKEMLGAITAELGQGVVTHGNLNNEIGVPLTLMRLTAQDKYAVVEMGMNQAGEIGRLTAITRPTVAVVNNAAAAHLEGLGSVEGVAKAKGEIFSGLDSDGIAIINADDPFAGLWSDLVVDKRVITFGVTNPADVTATYQANEDRLDLKVSALGQSIELSLNSVGEHSVRNALAAIATAMAAGISSDSVVRGLENYQPVKGRLNPIKSGELVVFDDTYNANPASMQAAIRVLSGYQGNVLIVGDMAELGDACEHEHIALGQFAAQSKIDTVIACGQYAHLVCQGFIESASNKIGADNALCFEDQATLLNHLQSNKLVGSAVLVKGSRSAKMEIVVEAILANQQSNDAEKQNNKKTKQSAQPEQCELGSGNTAEWGQ